MNIKDKLRQLDRSPAAPIRPSPPSANAPGDLAERLGGEWLVRGELRIVRVRRFYPLPCEHGKRLLPPPEQVDLAALRVAAKNSISEKFDLRRALFFDTETTGLAGGTGTYVFLVGVGYFEENRFVVEQLFLPELRAEPALLQYFEELLRERRGLVSFNGKSFDAPLLSSRFIQMRMSPTLDLHEHLDLLHAARRLVQQDFGDCRLGRLEERLLGVEREGDIPGEEIPAIYLDFLRFGDTGRLPPILYHNRMDILSLWALTVALVEVVRGAEENRSSPLHAERVARLYLQNRAPEKAAPIFENLLQQAPAAQAKNLEYWLHLARAQKQLGDFDRAAAAWQQAISAHPFHLEPFVELAKYFEHRAKDYHTALRYTERALAALEHRAKLNAASPVSRARQELLHRRDRLLRKLSRDRHR